MALHVGRKPDFIVDIGLLENETRTFLHIGEQPACNLYVADKIRFQPRHIVGFFVNPNHPGKLLDNLFFKLMRLEFRIRLKIEDQNVLSTKALAARVHELASAQKDLNAGLIFVFVLSLFLGLFFFSFFFGLALLVLFDAPPHPLAFLSCSFSSSALPSFFTNVVISSPSRLKNVDSRSSCFFTFPAPSYS